MAPQDFVRVSIYSSSSSGLPPDELTIGNLAKDAGYATGFIGKYQQCQQNTHRESLA